MNGSKFYAVVLFCVIIGAGIGFGAGWIVAGTPPAAPDAEMPTLKAGFIYVGPIGDFGWTHAHDVGRLYIEDKYDWLETAYIELHRSPLWMQPLQLVYAILIQYSSTVPDI